MNNSWIFGVQIAASVVFLFWLRSTYLTYRLGRKLHKNGWRREWPPVEHKTNARNALLWTIAMALCAEFEHFIARQKMGGEHGLLFAIHLPFAVMLLLSQCIMYFWKPGDVHPRVHSLIARYAFIPSALAMTFLGPILIWKI